MRQFKLIDCDVEREILLDVYLRIPDASQTLGSAIADLLLEIKATNKSTVGIRCC